MDTLSEEEIFHKDFNFVKFGKKLKNWMKKGFEELGDTMGSGKLLFL